MEKYWRFVFSIFLSTVSCSSPNSASKVFILILENTPYTLASAQPYLKSLAQSGVTFTNYSGLTHPSQPNYIGLTAGDHFGVDNSDQNLNVSHIGDLLENKGLRWRTYAEDFPGNCSLVTTSGYYARRHVPFLSFTNVTTQPRRCGNIKQGAQMFDDFSKNGVPEFSLYIPNNFNNGHDSSVAIADQWASNNIPAILSELKRQGNYTFILTFDEGNPYMPADNQVLTVVVGDRAKKGSIVSDRLNHYSLLRWVEKNFQLGNLGRNDATADMFPETKIFQ